MGNHVTLYFENLCFDLVADVAGVQGVRALSLRVLEKDFSVGGICDLLRLFPFFFVDVFARLEHRQPRAGLTAVVPVVLRDNLRLRK